MCVCLHSGAHTAATCHAPWALFKNYNIEQQQQQQPAHTEQEAAKANIFGGTATTKTTTATTYCRAKCNGIAC